LITSTVEICIQQLGRIEEMVSAARRSYASAVLGVVMLFACPSVRLSVCYTRALRLIRKTSRRYFSYSCAAADKISTDFKRRAVPLRGTCSLYNVLCYAPRFACLSDTNRYCIETAPRIKLIFGTEYYFRLILHLCFK